MRVKIDERTAGWLILVAAIVAVVAVQQASRPPGTLARTGDHMETRLKPRTLRGMGAVVASRP